MSHEEIFYVSGDEKQRAIIGAAYSLC